jgi:hypothetical protein
VLDGTPEIFRVLGVFAAVTVARDTAATARILRGQPSMNR